MRGKLGLVLKGRAMLSKSLIQFSVDGRGCVPSLISYLRRNYDEVNEDNGGLLQKVPCRHCCTQGPQPCSGPPLTHASAGGSWTCVGKSGSVSCGVTAPFSWVLLLSPGERSSDFVCALQDFVCALQESVSPVLCKFWQLSGRVNGNFL